MAYSIKSTDWADTTTIGEWEGREDDVVAKYNEMLEMMAEEIPEDDDSAWSNATHALWDMVGSDERLPDYTETEMKAAAIRAA